MTSHSSTNKFNTCPFSYKLSKIDGLHKVSIGPESNYAKWGLGIDAGLSAHYGGSDPFAAFDLAYPEDLDPKNKAWTREGGYKTLEEYINYYAVIDEQWEVLDIQHKDNPDRPTLVIDLVAKQKQTSSIYFWDHKCKKELKRDTGKRYELDSQVTRYTDYVGNKFGDCAGGLVNLIIPGYRANPYYPKKGVVEPAGFHFKFERPIYSRTPQQIEYWRRSQAEWEQVIDHCATTNLWPKHLGYSCSFCEFWELCMSSDDPEVRDALYATEAEDDKDEPYVVVVDED